jgi:hypothetical protein
MQDLYNQIQFARRLMTAGIVSSLILLLAFAIANEADVITHDRGAFLLAAFAPLTLLMFAHERERKLLKKERRARHFASC